MKISILFAASILLLTVIFPLRGLSQNNYQHIDLRSAVNQRYTDLVAEDGEGGWGDFGAEACLSKIPTGVQLFPDQPVPYSIIDPKENEGLSALFLSGPGREDRFPDHSEKIAVNQKLSSLYFLHTSMYASTDTVSLVNYRIHYNDGSEVIFECINFRQIADWWIPPEFMSGAIRCYEEENEWLISTPFQNPYPDKKISWIRMESTGKAIPILLAITGSKDPDTYGGFMTAVQDRIDWYDNKNLKLAMLQIRSEADQQWNLETGDKFVRTAKEKGADIAIFPEMYQIGYNSIDFDQEGAIERWKDMAINEKNPFILHFRNLARELEMAIVITYLRERENGQLPSNSASLIDRHGEIVFTYDKVHTCEFFNMENACTPGSGFYVHELDTEAGPVKIGMMICYDREAPESARILMLNGAEIILTPNACNLGQILLNQFQVRAFENAVAMAMANYGYGGDNQRFDGHSCMFNAKGERLLIAGSEEGVYTATINLHDLRNYRKETIWGNAFRRPHKYEKLISPDVEKVFERKDSFGNKFERLKR